MPPSPGSASGPTPPRPDLPAPPNAGAGYEGDPGWTQPIPRRRGRRLTAFFAVLALTVTSLGGGLAVIERLTRPSSDPSQHAFLLERLDGTPVRWNACDAIRYVVNPSTAPEGSIADVHEAVRRVSVATGIAFEYEGLTDEVPERRRPAYQPARYGGRWAPVLIAWVDPDQTNIPFDRSGHTAAAVASPTVPSGRDQVFVSGWIAMNLRDENPPGFGFAGAQGPVLLHELGHVMGLGHVDRMGEIMEPSGGNVADFGPGDLEGLRQVGRQSGCLAVPSPTP